MKKTLEGKRERFKALKNPQKWAKSLFHAETIVFTNL